MAVALLLSLALVATCDAALPGTAEAAAASVPPSGTIEGRPVHSGERPAPPGRPLIVPRRGANPATYAREKARAAQLAGLQRMGAAAAGNSVPARPALSSSAAAAVLGPLSAEGLSAERDIEMQGGVGDVTPPDTTGAIGPSDYVEFVNNEVAAYQRATLALAASPVALSKFTGGVEPCDVQIKYDPQASRWFYLALRCDGTTTANELYLGFSKTSDPTDLSTAVGHGWCGYAYSFGRALEDYPKLGLDALHIVIGTNSFPSSGPGFNTARIFSAPKPTGPISSCPTAPTLTAFGSVKAPLTTSLGDIATTPEPATVADSSPNGYVVAADEATLFSGNGKNIMIWQVAGTASAPELKALGDPAVPEFTLPPNVPQPGSSDEIDSFDSRLTQAVAAVDPTAAGAEAVWTQHTVAGGAGSVVRWYELLPSSATVKQLGTISEPEKFAFNGAIAPTLSGGAVIDYNTASSTALVQVVAQSRVSSAPAGTMSAPLTLGSSSAIDADFSCPSQPLGKSQGATSCRWGDYAGASVDPSNANAVWGSNQVNGPIGPSTASGHKAQWITRNFALEVATAPTIKTELASSITQTSATLNASVNPNGSEVGECKLEYGPTEAYGSSAPCTPSPGSGSSPVAVSAAVAGLSPNTTYHFRVSATNAAGTSRGSDQAFKTLPNPPSAETLPATAPSKTSATLNASVNPNGAEVSGCKFEYGATPSYGSSAPCTPAPASGTSPVAVSAAVGGLTERSTYHFRVSATNVGGTSKAADQTLRTLPAPHYYLNSLREGALRAGVKVQVLSWGALTIAPEAPSKATPVTCETVSGGFVENPEGLAGGAGRGQNQSEGAWNCESASCPAGLAEFPSGSGKFVQREALLMPGGQAGGENDVGGSLPWASELYEPKLDRVRTESKDVVLVLACVARKSVEGGPPRGDGDGDSPQLLLPATVCTATPLNLQAPLFEPGGQIGGPLTSKLHFDAESGKLSCLGPGEKEGEQVAFTAAMSGSLKTMTFEGQELLLAG